MLQHSAHAEASSVISNIFYRQDALSVAYNLGIQVKTVNDDLFLRTSVNVRTACSNLYSVHCIHCAGNAHAEARR